MCHLKLTPAMKLTKVDICMLKKTYLSSEFVRTIFRRSLYLFFFNFSRDVASGIDKHPDRTEIDFRLQIQGNRKLIPCSCTFWRSV